MYYHHQLSIVISPPSPLDAVPVPIDIDPDPPQDVVPVLNINSPLTPFVPAFNVRILMVPLDLSKLIHFVLKLIHQLNVL